MKTLSIDNGFGETRTFEIVEQLPNDNHYVVWNIGRKNFPFKNSFRFALVTKIIMCILKV